MVNGRIIDELWTGWKRSWPSRGSISASIWNIWGCYKKLQSRESMSRSRFEAIPSWIHIWSIAHAPAYSLLAGLLYLTAYALMEVTAVKFVCKFLLWTNIELLFHLKITSVHFPNKTVGLFPYDNRIMMCVNLAQGRTMYVCGFFTRIHEIGYRLKEFDNDMSWEYRYIDISCYVLAG
jgi:hypothetical protein